MRRTHGRYEPLRACDCGRLVLNVPCSECRPIFFCEECGAEVPNDGELCLDCAFGGPEAEDGGDDHDDVRPV